MDFKNTLKKVLFVISFVALLQSFSLIANAETNNLSFRKMNEPTLKLNTLSYRKAIIDAASEIPAELLNGRYEYIIDTDFSKSVKKANEAKLQKLTNSLIKAGEFAFRNSTQAEIDKSNERRKETLTALNECKDSSSCDHDTKRHLEKELLNRSSELERAIQVSMLANQFAQNIAQIKAAAEEI